jgi:hypothetical protein
MHRPPRLTFIVLATVIAGSAVAVSGTAAARSTSHSAAPPRALFRTGYDLCRAASLAAIRRAGGQPYKAGVFDGHLCNWERHDLKAGITLSTHPASVGAALMRGFLAHNGTKGIKAKRVKVPGASKAVLVTFRTQPKLRQVARDLFAIYADGTIQVNMTAPGLLPVSRLVAVMKLIARA